MSEGLIPSLGSNNRGRFSVEKPGLSIKYRPSFWLILLPLLAQAMSPGSLRAAPISAQDCARPLAERNIFMYTRSTHEKLAWMESINQDRFEAMKRDGSLVIPELAAMSYSEFSEKRDTLRKELNVHYSFEETVGLLHWYGNPDANDKWLECVKAVTEASVFEYYVQPGPDQDHAILKLYWRPSAEHAGKNIKLKWDVRAAKAKSLPKSITPGEFSVILLREQSKEIVGVVNGRTAGPFTRSLGFRIPFDLPPREAKSRISIDLRESVKKLPDPDGSLKDVHCFILRINGPSDWLGASLSFVQDSFYEQAIIVWEADHKVVRWGTNKWHQENLDGRLRPGHEYIIAAWNKPPGQSWRTSTQRLGDAPGEHQLSIGVDDAPIGQGDGDFDDVVIRVTY